jgi:hypothetical protein
LRALVHGVDRDEDGGIADSGCSDTTDSGFGMTMMMYVGIIEHDLPASAQRACPICLAFDEDVDEFPAKVARSRALRKRQSGIANCLVDSIDIEGVFHHRMADPVTAAGTGSVPQQNDLRLRQFNSGRARGDRRVEVKI